MVSAIAVAIAPTRKMDTLITHMISFSEAWKWKKNINICIIIIKL